jgi:hypothetical protein
MPVTKLTLSADRPLIKEAKHLAAARNTSVSAIFGRLLKALAAAETARPAELGPVTRMASGLLALPKGRTDRSLLEAALGDRYGEPG